MNYLDTDQYTRVRPDCPMSVDMHPVDDVVEIILGEDRFSGGSLRLQIDDPDTCARLIQSLDDARTQLIHNRQAHRISDPTTSQSDSGLTASLAG